MQSAYALAIRLRVEHLKLVSTLAFVLPPFLVVSMSPNLPRLLAPSGFTGFEIVLTPRLCASAKVIGSGNAIHEDSPFSSSFT